MIGSSVRAPQRWHNVSAKADNGVPSGEARLPSMAHTPAHSYNSIAPPKCESWAEKSAPVPAPPTGGRPPFNQSGDKDRRGPLTKHGPT